MKLLTRIHNSLGLWFYHFGIFLLVRMVVTLGRSNDRLVELYWDRQELIQSGRWSLSVVEEP